MGRHKRTSFVGKGSNSDVDSVPVAKKSKKVTDPPAKKAAKEEKSGKKLNNSCDKGKSDYSTSPSSLRESKKIKMQNIYTDTSSSSETESEKNSYKNDKKSEKSLSDSNSDSDSESESESSESDSSQVSNEKKKANNYVEPVKNTTNSIVNLHAVKSYVSPPKSSGSDSYHSDTEEEDKRRRKKQKELLRQQLTKKNRRGSPRKNDNFKSHTDVADDMEDDDDDDTKDGNSVQGNADETIDWPKSDVVELLRRMEKQVPEDDNQKFDSRAAKLDWQKISFADHSKQECQDMWNRISRRIRRFRKLSEMLDDAKEWASKSWTNINRGQKKVSKVITDMYKNLSDKERDKYSKETGSVKQNYEERITEFCREPTQYESAPVTKGSAKDGSKGPRKPYPPFKLFFQEELKKMYVVDGSVDKKAVEETAREKWRNFSDKRKAEWINLSLDDASRYKRELKAFMQKHPDYVAPNYNKSILNKEERLIMERLSGKPLKPPNSAYSLFSRHMLQSDNDVKSKAPKLRMAEISKKWKEMSATEKYRYEEKVKMLQEEYKSKLQSYLKSLTPEERQREIDLVKKEKRKKKETKSKTAKVKNTSAKTKKVKDDSSEPDFEEPQPPPVRVYDLFVQKFVANLPPGMSEEAKLKQASEQWEKMPDSKKEALQEELVLLKQRYVNAFGGYLKHLTADELKILSLKKAKARQEEQMQRKNGTLSDSNDESEEEKYESSSDGSDSDDSDSVRSKKKGSESGRSSSSDDSDG